jgi:hypothetical protein
LSVKTIRRLAVIFTLAIGLLAATAPFASAASKAPLRPAVACQKHTDWMHSWERYHGDDSLVVDTYVRRWTDNGGAYCGYMQPYTYVHSDCGAGCSSEPVVAQYVQLYQQSGLYLGGYSWSGLAYVDAWNGRWMGGPMIWVTCGSPVQGYSSAVEQYNVNGESDFGVTVPADGDSVGVWTSAAAPC